MASPNAVTHSDLLRVVHVLDAKIGLCATLAEEHGGYDAEKMDAARKLVADLGNDLRSKIQAQDTLPKDDAAGKTPQEDPAKVSEQDDTVMHKLSSMGHNLAALLQTVSHLKNDFNQREISNFHDPPSARFTSQQNDTVMTQLCNMGACLAALVRTISHLKDQASDRKDISSLHDAMVTLGELIMGHREKLEADSCASTGSDDPAQAPDLCTLEDQIEKLSLDVESANHLQKCNTQTVHRDLVSLKETVATIHHLMSTFYNPFSTHADPSKQSDLDGSCQETDLVLAALRAEISQSNNRKGQLSAEQFAELKKDVIAAMRHETAQQTLTLRDTIRKEVQALHAKQAKDEDESTDGETVHVSKRLDSVHFGALSSGSGSDWGMYNHDPADGAIYSGPMGPGQEVLRMLSTVLCCFVG